MNRNAFLKMLAGLCLGAAALATQLAPTPAHAQSGARLRHFVLQSSGLFEIRDDVNVGGRFTIAPTGERIQVPGYGARSVMGWTDRVSRGEVAVIGFAGSGTAREIAIRSNAGQHFRLANAPLPYLITWVVPGSPAVDNATSSLVGPSANLARRLRIGTR